MRRKETGVRCLCASEWERSCVSLCFCCVVCLKAHTGRLWARGCACASGCLFVCVWIDRRVGVLYWKVLLSSPVQHAGLAPAVSHGAVLPSPPPICIRRRQAEMWQTNLAHTAPAAFFTWTLSLTPTVTRKTNKTATKETHLCNFCRVKRKTRKV